MAWLFFALIYYSLKTNKLFMEIISIPQLRLGQLQTLTESTLKIAEPLTELADHVAKVKAEFATFMQGIQKDAAQSDKKTLDKTRDQFVSGFFFAVKSETYFPHVEQITKDAVAALSKLADKYGFEINRLSYDEQSAAVDNMIEEVEAINLTDLAHLSRWVAELKAANEAFKAAAKDFLTSTVEQSDTDSATQVAPRLTGELENLYTMLFAHAQVSGTDTLRQAYNELSALVDSYR
ncbi:MAG: DUF6261 family protein [Bacteroidota bacterium]